MNRTINGAQKRNSMKTHGMRRTKEYEAWQHMIQRCRNHKCRAYKNYGGRGIKVCERWLKFENFIQDVGLAPSKDHSLDRYPNNDGNYGPDNFRWATAAEQQINKRVSRGYEGKSLSQISLGLGGNRTLVTTRLRKGWNLEKAIFTPVNKNKSHQRTEP